MFDKRNAMDQTDLSISTDKTLLNVPLIVAFITNSYWGKDYLPAQIEESIKYSLCFGLYKNSNQIGFARVVADTPCTAWLYDVFILPQYQKLGYGKFLLEHVFNYPQLNTIDTWSLKTRDAHELYEKFGFRRVENSERLMHKLTSNK